MSDLGEEVVFEMFMDSDEDIISDEILALWGGFSVCSLRHMQSIMDQTSHVRRRVPTHTEDGIPIRKIYVTNLPYMTNRSELFGFFAQYGFIKSCWLKTSEHQGMDSSPYAFITFLEPADAHKALVAPAHERRLRGKHLRVSPADSWHQPGVDADGKVQWPARRNHPHIVESNEGTSSTATHEELESTNPQAGATEPEEYNIMDILNPDCLAHVMSYLSLRELILTERVSQRWRNIVRDYFHSIRAFKTSCWDHSKVTLTTQVLRHLLQRLGPRLSSFHIDQDWSALNDRTAHTVGRFCPNLEHFEVVGMPTKNWNPVVYCCKQLRSMSFTSCNKMTDVSLIPLISKDSSVESISVSCNSLVAGLFLSSNIPRKLNSIALHNCYSLHGSILLTAIPKITQLTCLKLDKCLMSVWNVVPGILTALPALEEVSLAQYSSSVGLNPSHSEELCSALEKLTELRSLDLNRNAFANDTLLKHIAKSCKKLTKLNISGCNAQRSIENSGIGEKGLLAVARGCSELRELDVSCLVRLVPAGVSALKHCSQLRVLTARGNPNLTDTPLQQCLQSCHQLEELDVCRCDLVTEGVVAPCVASLQKRPRRLKLYLAATAAINNLSEVPTHSLLKVNVSEDRSVFDLQPDFGSPKLDDSDDDSSLPDDHLGDVDDFYSDEDYDFDEEDFDEHELEIDFENVVVNPEFLFL